MFAGGEMEPEDVDVAGGEMLGDVDGDVDGLPFADSDTIELGRAENVDVGD